MKAGWLAGFMIEQGKMAGPEVDPFETINPVSTMDMSTR